MKVLITNNRGRSVATGPALLKNIRPAIFRPLFITYFIMEPVWSKIDSNALQPYMAKQISSEQALTEASKPIRAFMLKQARAKDVELFASLANVAPKTADELPLKVVIPG